LKLLPSFRRKPESRILTNKLDPGFRRDDVFWVEITICCANPPCFSHSCNRPCGNNRVVFNIAGNKYRLVVELQYQAGIVWVKFVGTHARYDQINVETVNEY